MTLMLEIAGGILLAVFVLFILFALISAAHGEGTPNREPVTEGGKKLRAAWEAEEAAALAERQRLEAERHKRNAALLKPTFRHTAMAIIGWVAVWAFVALFGHVSFAIGMILLGVAFYLLVRMLLMAQRDLGDLAGKEET